MENKKALLTYRVLPHQLNEEGDSRFCVVEMCLDDGKNKYYESNCLFSEYILTSRYPDAILETAIVSLKDKFLKHFSETEVDDSIDIPEIKKKIEEMWKQGLTSGKK